MNSHSAPKSDQKTQVVLIGQESTPLNELERFAAAYVRFDALMTAQLQELEFRFRDYWTPQAKKQEKFGRR